LRAAPRRAPSPAHTDAPRFLSTNILKSFVSIRESRKGCGQALSQRPLTPVASEALSPQEEKKKKKKKKRRSKGTYRRSGSATRGRGPAPSHLLRPARGRGPCRTPARAAGRSPASRTAQTPTASAAAAGNSRARPASAATHRALQGIDDYPCRGRNFK
jgi:hypothetical protein